MGELISLRDLASYLGVEPGEHVYVLMSEKRLPAALVGGVWKFHPGEVDRWIEENGGRDCIDRYIAEWEQRRAGGGDRDRERSGGARM